MSRAVGYPWAARLCNRLDTDNAFGFFVRSLVA